MTSTSKGTTSPRPNIRDRSEASSGNPSPKERQRTDVTGDNETKAGDDDTALVRPRTLGEKWPPRSPEMTSLGRPRLRRAAAGGIAPG